MSNAVAGIAQTIASGLMLVLLYRFFLDRLGAVVLGEWSLMLAMLGLARILDFGLTGAGVKLTAESLAGNKFTEARCYTRWSILGTGLLTMPGVVIAVVVIPSFVGAVGIGAHFGDIGMLAAMGSAVWLGFVLQSLRGAIDSLQRVDLRHLTIALQAMFFLVLAWILVPAYGEQGLVAAFLLASGFTAIFAAVMLHRLWSPIPVDDDPRSSATFMRGMIRYGIPFHITGIASQLYDPLTKYLLGCFSSLAAVAWYEMASRLVLLLRGLLVSAMEALVPYVAKVNAVSAPEVAGKYIAALRISLFVGVPWFMALVASSPFISWAWIGAINLEFIALLQLLSVAWLINTISAPAYFFALGLGRQRWNLVAHVLIAILVLTLSSLFGVWFGSVGVVLGYSLAVSAGSIVLMAGFHRDRGIGMGGLSWDPPAIVSVVISAITVALCILWWMVPEAMRFVILSVGVGLALLAGLAPLLEPAVGRRVRYVLGASASEKGDS